MTRHGGANLLILATIILAGCHNPDPHRQLELSTDDCLRANKRAVIICNSGTGECRVECREKIDD